MVGSGILLLSISSALSLLPTWHPWNGSFTAGGIIGLLLADTLMASLNLTGAALLTAITLILSIYLISSFSMSTMAKWLEGPMRVIGKVLTYFENWRSERRQIALERAELRAQLRAEQERAEEDGVEKTRQAVREASAELKRARAAAAGASMVESAPVETHPPAQEEEIPIHTLEYDPRLHRLRPRPWKLPRLLQD